MSVVAAEKLTIAVPLPWQRDRPGGVEGWSGVGGMSTELRALCLSLSHKTVVAHSQAFCGRTHDNQQDTACVLAGVLLSLFIVIFPSQRKALVSMCCHPSFPPLPSLPSDTGYIYSLPSPLVDLSSDTGYTLRVFLSLASLLSDTDCTLPSSPS